MLEEFLRLPGEEQARRLGVLAEGALNRWDVAEPQLRLIKYRENAVFEVSGADDFHAALRVHRQGYHSDEHLSGELRWMAMLANGGVTVPDPMPTRSGELMIKAASQDVPGQWQVDMLSWLDGRELGAIGEPLQLKGRDPGELFAAIGATMARLHNLSAAWPEQNSILRHAWDADGLVGPSPFWGRFWEMGHLSDAQRTLVLQAQSAIADDLAGLAKTDANYGLIHADFVPENIMLGEDGVMIIDFDDAGFGWHMFDIVTALYWLVEEPQYAQMREGFMRGYRSERALAQKDLAAWDVFVAARSLTYLGWAHTRGNNPTVEELAPTLVEMAEAQCRHYLDGRTS